MNDKAQGMINANIPVLDKVVIPGKRLGPAAEEAAGDLPAEAAETDTAQTVDDVLLTEEAAPTPKSPDFFGITGQSAAGNTQELAVDINARQAVDTAVDQVLEKLMPKIETLTRDALRAAVHDILVEQKNRSTQSN